MRPWVLAAVTVALAGARAGGAAADDRAKLAVLILGASPGDGELAENVTELLIARIAERGGSDLIGTPEVRRRAASLAAAVGPAGCADERSCLARAAVALGASRALVGSVGRSGQRFLLDVAVVDLTDGRRAARAERVIDAEPGALVKAVREVAAVLLAPPAEPGVSSRAAAEARRLALDLPSQTPPDPGQTAAIALVTPPGAAGPRARLWPRYAFYGSGIASVGALSVGLVFGGLAQQPITSNVRREAQRELQQRRAFGLAADVALVSSATLAAACAYLFLRNRHDIFAADASSE